MSTYYLSRILTTTEATRRFQGRVIGNQLHSRTVNEEGFYKIVIRKEGDPGWTFRFQNIGDGVTEILDRLNGGAAWSEAA